MNKRRIAQLTLACFALESVVSPRAFAFSQNGEVASSAAKLCATRFASIRQLERTRVELGINPDYRKIDQDTQVVIDQMASDLNPLQRARFLAKIRQAHASVIATSNGKYKFRQLHVNPFAIDHPMSRLALVHEGQHYLDDVPGAGFLGSMIKPLVNTRWSEATERNAFSREYDLLQRWLQIPGFLEERKRILAAISFEPGGLPEYTFDKPLFNEWGEFSREFLDNPQAFYREPTVVPHIEAFVRQKTEEGLVERLKNARQHTREQYIQNRLIMYDEQFARGRQISIMTRALVPAVGGMLALYTALIIDARSRMRAQGASQQPPAAAP